MVWNSRKGNVNEGQANHDLQWARNLRVSEETAAVYLHNPPVSIDNVTSTEGLPISIHVKGDIISKKYDFMMGDLDNNPYKIAQVVRQFQAFFERQTYFLEIGPNVDIAFMCICAYAIDELFTEGWGKIICRSLRKS